MKIRELRLREPRGTYKAQRLLASEEAEEHAQASRNKKYPELYLLYVYAANALEYAKSICLMSRGKEQASAQNFVLEEVRLAEYVDRLQDYPNLTDCLQQWPKNPGIAIAWFAGRSALEVIIQFVQSIRVAAIIGSGERACHGVTSYDALQVSPECDLRFTEWKNRTINELCEKTIPKPDVWPSRADILKECHQVFLKLEDEYNRAEDRSLPTVHEGDNSKKWDVFICHASEDKETFVEPLANALKKSGFRVWYDRFELTLGDSLRDKIDEGLANSRYGVVVLSNAFFNKKWAKTELDALVSRQNEHGKKSILPIWHEVDEEEVRKFSPILAGKLAVQSSEPMESIVVKIEIVLNESSTLDRQTTEAKREEEQTATEQPGNSEQEGRIEPKPPEYLQHLLWYLKHGRRYWKLILIALIISAILLCLKLGVHNKILHLFNNDSPSAIGRTQLYSRTQKRVQDAYETIEEEKLNPWTFINIDKMRPVTMHDGKVYSPKGVLFGDSVRLVFWSDDFMPPFIEEAIVQVFDETIEECHKGNLEPKPYIDEANSLLMGFIWRVYNHMADLDRKLARQVDSSNTGREDISLHTEEMERCLKGHYDAALLLASKKDRAN